MNLPALEDLKIPIIDSFFIALIAFALFYKYIVLALVIGVFAYAVWKMNKDG